MKFQGREISLKDLEKGKFQSIEYATKFNYRWDTGIAIGRFLAELKKGKIVGARCNKCKRILVPPRIFCEKDFININEWVYVKDTGRVNTYSVAYISADASRLKKPIIVAVIELDGASRNIGILHKIAEISPEEMYINMRVKAVWKPKRERSGAITDILYFKPVG